MFRPNPERTLFGYVPVRLILSVLFLFALFLSVGLVISLELEKVAIERLIAAERGPADPHPRLPFLSSRWDVLKVGLLLLLLMGVGVGFIATYQNYQTATKSHEQVKSLTRDILQSIPTGVITLNLDGRITSVNAAAERLLGKPSEALLGRPLAQAVQNPDLLRLVETASQDGRVREADILHPPHDDQRFALRVSTSELRDPRGRASGLVLLLRDITELRRLDQQLRRADKLAALGTLAAGVAHEVKNPLSAMELNLLLLEEELKASQPDATELASYLDILRGEAHRLQRIVDNFLRFSRPTVPAFKAVDLNEVLDHVLNLLAYEASDRGVRTIADLAADLPAIQGDETQLSQVFLNVIINALQAMPHGGQLVVRSARRGSEVTVEVADSGEGIAPEHLARLFDPFFTTRPGGVGLGLSIAHRIVEDHRGSVDVESVLGQGTRITVRLPIEPPAASPRVSDG